MNKKLILSLVNLLALSSTPILLACKNNNVQIQKNFQAQKTQLDPLISKHKEISPASAIDIAVSSSLERLQKQETILENIITKKSKSKKLKKKEVNKKKQQLIDKQEQELLEEIHKLEVNNNEIEKRHKVIALGLVISGSVVAGIAAGLGAYFGVKDISSVNNVKKDELKEKIEVYNEILKSSKSNEPLINIFNKLLELTFSHQLPKAIFDILKQTVLKDFLQDFDESNENILIKKLEAIEQPSKEIIEKFSQSLINLNINDVNNNYIKTIVDNIKKEVVNIVNERLPKILKGLLEFLATRSQNKNGSIFARIFESILKKYKIEVLDLKNISDIFNTYTNLIISEKSELIDFLVNKFSLSLEKTNFTYDIIDDLFSVLNLTIQNILTKENNKLDIEIIFKELLPKILNTIKIQNNNSYSSFVTFINKMFEEKNGQTKKWVYQFLETKSPFPNNNVQLSSSKNKNKISFPSYDFNFSGIIDILKKYNDIDNLIWKFMEFLYYPLIIELNNNVNNKEAKKAIFRLSGLLAFIYYKFLPFNENKFAGSLIRLFNKYDPDKYVVNFLKQNVKNVPIESILGKYYYKFPFFYATYNIFYTARNDLNHFKDVLMKGIE